MGKFPVVETTLERIVGGGQALGTYPDGRKLFVWGGLPGETVRVQVTKKRSKLVEGRVIEVLKASKERVAAKDETSFLSTSPWQIFTPDAESHYKSALIEEAFELHNIVLPNPIEVISNSMRYEYRNKMEFSFYWDTEFDRLELAFFIRGSKGKVLVDQSALAKPEINVLARQIRDTLRNKDIEARSLKTLLIRCDQTGRCVWQLYVKDLLPDIISQSDAQKLNAIGGEIIYSDPKSPASRITKRLATYGTPTLSDTIAGVAFSYATESFFQVNIPMYEHALEDMKSWLSDRPTIDMYSGVGTIGLTIGSEQTTLIEIDEAAVGQMRMNINALKSTATVVHASSETALSHIIPGADIIVDPPRAGLHSNVIYRLLEVAPERIIYLSCNPVTQARDVALLADKYGIKWHKGYNFFQATPHIEHLLVLDKKLKH